MKISTLFLALLLTSSVRAGTSDKLQAIADHYVQQYHDVEHMSAVTLTVANLSQSPITVYSGYTQYSGKQPINSSNLYQIGSITKSFISAIILQLEADPEYHFNIDDKLSTYLPEYLAWGNITVRQLLNMTSGIPDYLEQDSYRQDLASNPFRKWLPEEEVSYVTKLPLLFAPGTGWSYSNTNYILAGMIISKLTGHTLEQEINDRFLAPNNSSHLALHNTYYVSHYYPPGIVSRMVHGYHFGGDIGKFIPLTTDVTNFSLSYAGAAGAIVSNTTDITQWIAALLTPNKILPVKQLNELMTLVSMRTGRPLVTPNDRDRDGFGLGIGISIPGSDLPGLIINYEGMTLGYRAEYLYFKKKNLLIAGAVNSSVTDNDTVHNDHLTADLLIKAYLAQ